MVLSAGATALPLRMFYAARRSAYSPVCPYGGARCPSRCTVCSFGGCISGKCYFCSMVLGAGATALPLRMFYAARRSAYSPVCPYGGARCPSRCTVCSFGGCISGKCYFCSMVLGAGAARRSTYPPVCPFDEARCPSPFFFSPSHLSPSFLLLSSLFILQSFQPTKLQLSLSLHLLLRPNTMADIRMTLFVLLMERSSSKHGHSWITRGGSQDQEVL